MHAAGPFDVKITPQPPDGFADGAVLARLTIDKQFHGELEATGRGQMLSGAGTVKGSAGYVAIERVTGTLAGRHGSFVLQHNAFMNRGAPELAIRVIPDSGTDELTGIEGTMQIVIEGGKHSYDFTYSLPPAP